MGDPRKPRAGQNFSYYRVSEVIPCDVCSIRVSLALCGKEHTGSEHQEGRSTVGVILRTRCHSPPSSPNDWCPSHMQNTFFSSSPSCQVSSCKSITSINPGWHDLNKAHVLLRLHGSILHSPRICEWRRRVTSLSYLLHPLMGGQELGSCCGPWKRGVEATWELLIYSNSEVYLDKVWKVPDCPQVSLLAYIG